MVDAGWLRQQRLRRALDSSSQRRVQSTALAAPCVQLAHCKGDVLYLGGEQQLLSSQG